MRVHSITTTQANVQNSKRNGITFGTYNPAAARKIEGEIAQKGIICNTQGNDFVARCYKQTVEVFEKLFGKSYMPDRLDYKNITGDDRDCYGYFQKFGNEVVINRNHDDKCYYGMDNLRKEAESNYNSILPSWHSTKHPAYVFVHEFSHAAHWNHLYKKLGWEKAKRVWEGLDDVHVPTSIGKLITKFKLSKYAVEGDMLEFMAERMTKDICGGLTDEMWVPYKDIDVDYSNIFSKKWNYRYSSPQSYIDYFTQQVWDGDIDEAKRTGDKVEAYLAELEAERVAPIVQKVQAKTENLSLLQKLGRCLANWSESYTDKLDERNKIKLH